MGFARRCAPQLIEFTADSRKSRRNGASANIAFTRSWQPSKSPSTAMLSTLGASTVVICRRCTALVRPAGCRMAMSTRSRSRHASMAAEPVSPEVAPTMVTRWSRAVSTWSNRRPSTCIAMSLNARVGPWNSSSDHRSGPSCTSGATAGWANPA